MRTVEWGGDRCGAQVSALKRGGLGRSTVSRTDKDRPHRIQIADPCNRRFRMVGNRMWARGNEEYFWKKLSPATQCMCCSHRAWLRYKRKRRSGWKREVKGMDDGGFC